MSTPNPLAPQGSLLEQQGRGKSTLQIITFIGALHVFFLCGLLWIGCKKDDKGPNPVDPLAGNPPINSGIGADTNLTGIASGGYVPSVGSPLVSTGAPLPLVALPSNTVVVPPVVIPPAADNTGTGTGVATAAGEYKVQKGDIGVSIAKKNHVSLAALKAANPTVKWSALKIDQRIQIPATDGTKPTGAGTTGTTGTTAGGTGTTLATDAAGGTVYEVKPGDTGGKIAHKFGVSWKAIRAANQLTSDNLKPKQKLTIPAKGTAAATGTAPIDTGASAVPTVPTATPLVSPAPIGNPGRP